MATSPSSEGAGDWKPEARSQKPGGEFEFRISNFEFSSLILASGFWLLASIPGLLASNAGGSGTDVYSGAYAGTSGATDLYRRICSAIALNTGAATREP